MPHLSVSTIESTDSIREHTATILPKPEEAFHWWQELSRLANIDESGRIPVRPIVIACRRHAVMKLFTGDNYKTIAELLDISIDTVQKDVAWHYDQLKRKNGKKRFLGNSQKTAV